VQFEAMPSFDRPHEVSFAAPCSQTLPLEEPPPVSLPVECVCEMPLVWLAPEAPVPLVESPILLPRPEEPPAPSEAPVDEPPELSVPPPPPLAELQPTEDRKTTTLAQATPRNRTAMADGDTRVRRRQRGASCRGERDQPLLGGQGDLRKYREAKLAGVGMSAVFPLWGRSTSALVREMLEVGLRATVTCIDPRKLDKSFAGRSFDAGFLADIPVDVDPCGENGEFHTFASAGPMFTRAIHIEVGEVVERDGFVFADVLPAPAG